MNYTETLDYLFNVAPLFQNIGQGAYKEGLHNTLALDEHFNHPTNHYRTIHVAGTNGKGSCSHTIAAILQQAGYRVGLYTSPHLIDFRERIRVNGEMITEQRVIDFVAEERDFFEPLYPSFFELTTALAFQYFKEQQVDVAVIEVGLGGRLDCTNIISPDLCVITNISFDHMQFLGNTLPEIASEKAGIIKPNIPVIIGETNGNQDVRSVFENKATEVKAPIVFADESDEIIDNSIADDGGWLYSTKHFGRIHGELGGYCQQYNARTILCAANELISAGYKITTKNIADGFLNVCSSTGLMGRWQMISSKPKTFCDTGHNPGGLQYIGKQLEDLNCEKLRIVVGMVSDKDVTHSLCYLPKNAEYYFTQAGVKRAMDVGHFSAAAADCGLHGKCYESVSKAYEQAVNDSGENDVIFVGGSTFIVADLLSWLQKQK